jgi:hypothetical protein
VDSVAAIASGAISSAANLVESALAKALPLVIDLLARLLGLGGLAKKIKNVIMKVRKKIDKVIDKVIIKAKKAGKKLLRKLGVGKDKPEKFGNVRDQAHAMLSNKLGSGKSLAEVQTITRDVKSKLGSKGLKQLKVVKKGGDGDVDEYSILAQASPTTDLLKLKSKIPAAKSAAMVSAVTLTLQEKVESTMPIGVEEREVGSSTYPEAGTIKKGYISEGSHGARGTVEEVEHKKLGKHRYASIPGRTGYKGSGGALFVPEPGAKKVQLMTWNAGKMDKKNCSNRTHAETQFIEWFNARPLKFRQSVVGIEIANKPYSPCAFCSHSLANFLRRLNKQSDNDIKAKISWTKLYTKDIGCKELTTTNSSLSVLQSAGWVLEGERPKDGPTSHEKEKSLEVVSGKS